MDTAPAPPRKLPRTEDYQRTGSTAAAAVSASSPASPQSREASPAQANPMMNNVVLKRLFELSCPEDLNPYRRVCKLWHKIVTPVWLQNGPTILIKDKKNSDKFLQFLEQVHLESPTTRNKDMTVGIQKYRKFLLEPYNRIYGGQRFEVFWTKCGDYLTHLTLQKINIPDAATFQSILFCRRTPNLESLVVDIHTVEGPVEPRLLQYSIYPEHEKLKTLMIDVAKIQSDHFPLDWKTLLNTFPNLTHFGIGRLLPFLELAEVEPQADQILVAINEIRKEDRNKLTLRSFIWFFNQCNLRLAHCFEYPASLPIPAELHQAKFANLEAFKFCFADTPEPAIKNILALHAGSLRKLEIYISTYFESCPFPAMMALTTLEISAYAVKDLAFVKKLPNLRSLQLWGDDSNFFADTKCAKSLIVATIPLPGNGDVLVFPSLSEFSCDYSVRWTENDFTRLSELMPNLNNLGMRLDNTNFRLVCRYFSQQLQHLSVLRAHSVIGDEGLIGLTTDGLTALMNGEDEDQIHFIAPNITNLQNLKSFAIQGATKFGQNFFSNYFITRGLAKLPRLEKLYISVKDKPIKPHTKQSILEKFPFAKLTEVCQRCGREF